TNAAGGGVGTEEALLVAISYWDEVFESLADYSDSVAKGSTTIITEGGWDYTDIEPTTRPVPSQVVGLKISQMEQSGSIKVTQRYKTANKDEYVDIISTDQNLEQRITVINNQLVIAPGDKPMIIIVHTKNKQIVTNLDSGTRYYGYRFAK